MGRSGRRTRAGGLPLARGRRRDCPSPRPAPRRLLLPGASFLCSAPCESFRSRPAEHHPACRHRAGPAPHRPASRPARPAAAGAAAASGAAAAGIRQHRRPRHCAARRGRPGPGLERRGRAHQWLPRGRRGRPPSLAAVSGRSDRRRPPAARPGGRRRRRRCAGRRRTHPRRRPPVLGRDRAEPDARCRRRAAGLRDGDVRHHRTPPGAAAARRVGTAAARHRRHRGRRRDHDQRARHHGKRQPRRRAAVRLDRRRHDRPQRVDADARTCRC